MAVVTRRVPPTRTYAPALTRPAFANMHTGGTYQSYLNYLAKHRPGWDPAKPMVAQQVRPTPLVSGPVSYSSLLDILRPTFQTPAQLEAQANRMAGQSQAASLGMIKGDYAQAAADALARMKAVSAAGIAAAGMNASLIPYVGAGYRQGADLLSNMASGLSAGASGAVQGDVAAANAAASAVGAPQVTEGGPVGSPGIAGPAQAGVESYRGGTLPAEALQNAAGYAEAGLQGQIGAANLRATQEGIAAYNAAMHDATAARQEAVRQLALGRPQIAAQWLQQFQDNQRQGVALAMSLIGQIRASQQQGFEQGMTTKQFAETVKQHDITNQQWQTQYGETKREFNATMKQHQADSRAQAQRWAQQLTASGKAVTPRQQIAQIMSGLGQSAYNPKFQNFIATLFYTSPSLATVQPSPQNKADYNARTNAVISYLMNTYWPTISSMIKQGSPAQAQTKAAFEQQIRAWFAGMALPQLQTWKLASIKGG